jgi:dethiobiotin synthetase
MELPHLPKLKGIFITGTDTDVGKTWVAAGLTAVLRRWGLKAVYFKPVQSGCPEEGGRLIPTDALLAREVAGLEEPLELLTPITLRLPLAPAVAACQEGRTVELAQVAAALEDLSRRHDIFVVEGAGGLCVPVVNLRFWVLHLAAWLKLPLMVVAKPGLGSINHTVLTVSAAHQAGVPVAGIVLNRYPARPSLAESTNPEVIAALTELPILGRVPEVRDLRHPGEREIFLAAMDEVARHLADACAARAFLECILLEG